MTLPGRCPRCFGTPEGCVCAHVVPVESSASFVILQHVLEQGKVSNTGRVAALALTRCELRVYGGDARVDDLALEGTWLLYPSDEASVTPSPKPGRVVVLDASWSQARRMVQRVEVLRRLPRLSLPAVMAAPSLRRAPPGGMSTLQAIARCVEMLDGADVARPLDVLHDELVARVVRSRGYL